MHARAGDARALLDMHALGHVHVEDALTWEVYASMRALQHPGVISSTCALSRLLGAIS